MHTPRADRIKEYSGRKDRWGFLQPWGSVAHTRLGETRKVQSPCRGLEVYKKKKTEMGVGNRGLIRLWFTVFFWRWNGSILFLACVRACTSTCMDPGDQDRLLNIICGKSSSCWTFLHSLVFKSGSGFLCNVALGSLCVRHAASWKGVSGINNGVCELQKRMWFSGEVCT